MGTDGETTDTATGFHIVFRIVRAAAEAMGSGVAVDLGEHRNVAAAVLRELAKADIGRQFPADYLTDLADEIEGL